MAIEACCDPFCDYDYGMESQFYDYYPGSGSCYSCENVDKNYVYLNDLNYAYAKKDEAKANLIDAVVCLVVSVASMIFGSIAIAVNVIIPGATLAVMGFIGFVSSLAVIGQSSKAIRFYERTLQAPEYFKYR